jgi:hypothetical protein
MISSILRQLLEQLPELPASVKELYEARTNPTGHQILEYERLLKEICEASDTVYLVFDALDECGDLKYILQLIDALSQIISCRVLVTSRPHIYEQLQNSCSFSELKIEAQEDDIRTYVLEQCDAANIQQIADTQFMEQLAERLTQSARGMYSLTLLATIKGRG